jgi:hypothetical protein
MTYGYGWGKKWGKKPHVSQPIPAEHGAFFMSGRSWQIPGGY